MKKQYVKEAFARYLLVIIAIAFATLSVTLGNAMTNSRRTQLQDQQAKIEELNNRITIIQRTQQQAQEKAVSVVTGLDSARMTKDKDAIEAFLTKIMSWKSWDEYNDVRAMLMEDYKVAKDSSMLTEFMPEVPNEVSNDGKTNYNDIDANGLSVTYDSMDLYLTDTIGDTCHYTAFVKWHTSDEKGRTSSAQTIFTLSVANDGTIGNLYAFA